MADRTIETARLRLQPVDLGSARALLAGRPSGLRAGAGWPHADTLDGLGMDVRAGDPDNTGWYVVLRSTGEVIGDCGWKGGPDAAGEAEIGYGLAAPYRRRGYGVEAVAGLVDWCERQPGVRRLVAEVLSDNTASRRLLERTGFTVVEVRADGYLRYARPGDPPATATGSGTRS